MKHNWWGTTNTTQIDSQIFDYEDDFNKGKVSYLPILNSNAYFPASYASILSTGALPEDIDTDEPGGGDPPDDPGPTDGLDDTEEKEYDPLDAVISEGLVCAEITIDRDDRTTTTNHTEGFTIDLTTINRNELTVVVDGVSQQGKLVIINIPQENDI